MLDCFEFPYQGFGLDHDYEAVLGAGLEDGVLVRLKAARGKYVHAYSRVRLRDGPTKKSWARRLTRACSGLAHRLRPFARC